MNELVDYSGDSTDSDTADWSPSAFKRYFLDSFWKVHKTGGAVPWRMKEQALLKGMLKEYQPEDLTDMILYWHINTPKSAVACQFTNFYSDRINIYHKMKKASDDYSWD